VERNRAVTGTRRNFLGVALVGLTPKAGRPIAGGFVNDSFVQGHLLRDRAPFRPPSERVRIPLVIVGSGIAGLSAAWRLAKRGFRDFVLLEMESQPGGNARSGENEVSAYPWAAHYVPVPGRKSLLVRELFEELGLLHEGRWEERHLCHSPQERLFLHGRWQEGIEPEIAATAQDRQQYQRFDERMNEFRASGEFAIPMETGGVKDVALDRISMAEWMRREKFDSPYLNWYVNYACRDDYGALAAETSAWAGIHYFASREPDEKGPLTWPEGNGWIVKELLAKLGRFVETRAMVRRITRDRKRLRVLTEQREYVAEVVIFAAPTFLAEYVLDHAPPARSFQYSPWLTANLTLDRWPRERGIETAWDNVIYDSPTLGYVVATHQSLRTHIERTVWTFYWSLAEGSPAANRRLLLDKDWAWWRDAILSDLSRAHPDIRSCVSRLDVMRLGHAMVRPAVGFIFSDERRKFAAGMGNVLFANSDLSGLSLFEEAQYRGVKAADRALRLLAR
jgi:glycine/D-amino acid oxidase-like deaminating enzyme